MPKIPVAGVYEIKNLANNKVYIGSSVNVGRRITSHKGYLRRGEHSSAHLQSAWNKYGLDSFTFKQLIACSPGDVLFYEQLLIEGYGANKPAIGYNKRVVADSNAGRVLSQEHRAKIAASVPRGKDHRCFGVGLSPQAYEAAAALKRGKPMPEAQRAKLSAATKGVKKPLGFGDKVSRGRAGFFHSLESRNKMSIARTGMVQTREAKENKGKLTYAKVDELRELAASGVGPHSKLAEMFGVSRGRVSAILRGESWT